MPNVFPAFSTVSLKEARPGSIIKIARSGGPKLALVTDHFTKDVRSFVWINPGFKDRAPIIFAENWRNDPCVLQYGPHVRFELRINDEDLDPGGRASWETTGAIVLIGSEFFIRAAPDDSFYGHYPLVNVRSGAVSFDRPPDNCWAFLSWQIWDRDPLGQRDYLITEFRAT